MSTRKSFFRESWITYVHYGRDGEMVDDWNFLALHGKTNWLEGIMLIAAYFLIASAFFFMKDDVERF